jgi:uncharacterized protein YeaO (DUF488 family)
MIQCKRVYEQASPDDGYRVLVDRLWPRGVKKTDLAYDEWCKTLTPSNELRKAFHSETIDFAPSVRPIGKSWRSKDEECVWRRWQQADRHPALWRQNTEQNHALVLADWLRHL